jgi:uncharacterized membrane protein (DUF106 family)
MTFTETINAIVDPVMVPFMNALPSPYNLILVIFIITGVVTLVYKFFTDQKLMKEIKDESKLIRDQMKEFKDNPEKVIELQKKSMENVIKTFKQSMKANLITMIPVLLVFTWLRSYYVGLGDPKILFGLSWFWVYLIFAIVISMTLRKVLKIH